MRSKDEIDPVLNVAHPKADDNMTAFPLLMTLSNNFHDFYLSVHFPFYSDSRFPPFFCFFSFASFFCMFVLAFMCTSIMYVRHFTYCYCYRSFHPVLGMGIVLLALDVLELQVFIVIVCFYPISSLA